MLMTYILSCILGFAGQPPAAEKQQDKPAEKEQLKLTIEGDVTKELIPVAGKLTELFYESYPKLLERFENPDKPAPRNIRIIFDSKLKIPAHCSGGRVVVGVDWLTKHPNDYALLTHELTHAVQAYPNGNPGWITEGIADYARHLYGPKVQQGWALPTRLTERQNYKDSYRTSGKFFLWLDEKHPGTVDKIHRAMQDRSYEETMFKKLTDKTIDELWKDCVEDFKKKQ
jgi:hypothetical protein